MLRGSWAWKSSSKGWEFASVWGEAWRYKSHSAQEEFQCLRRKFRFLVSTPGKTQRPAAEGPSTKHKRHRSTQGAPCLSNALQVCYGFYSCNYGGIQTTSWDCKSDARINVFPFQGKEKKKKKKRQCSYLTYVLDSFEWIKRKGLMWFQWSVCFSCCSLWIVIVVSRFIVLTGQKFKKKKKSIKIQWNV